MALGSLGLKVGIGSRRSSAPKAAGRMSERSTAFALRSSSPRAERSPRRCGAHAMGPSSRCSHAWLAPPDRQQDRVPRLGPPQPAQRSDGVSGKVAVKELDKDDLESDALSLEARQAAHPLDQLDLLLEEAEPAGSLGRFSPKSVWEEILDYQEVRH